MGGDRMEFAGGQLDTRADRGSFCSSAQSTGGTGVRDLRSRLASRGALTCAARLLPSTCSVMRNTMRLRLHSLLPFQNASAGIATMITALRGCAMPPCLWHFWRVWARWADGDGALPFLSRSPCQIVHAGLAVKRAYL